jgi:hypothetical protein
MDTTRMACPACGTINAMIAVINDTRQYLCSSCGERYYTPNSCLNEAGSRSDSQPASAREPDPTDRD